IKRQNASDAMNDLVRIAKEIEQRKDHNKQIKNKSGDVLQDRAEPLGKKSRLFLNTLRNQLEHIGVGIQARDMVRDPRPAFGQKRSLLAHESVLDASRNGKRLSNEQGAYKDRRHDQQEVHREGAENCCAVWREASCQPMVHRVEKYRQNGGPAQRRQERLANSED